MISRRLALIRLSGLLCLLLCTSCVRFFSDSPGHPAGKETGGDLAPGDATGGDHLRGQDSGPRGDVFPLLETGPALDQTASDLFLVPDGGCPSGTTACGGDCIDLASDPQNCGACAMVCATGQDCVKSSCTCVKGGSCAGCCEGNTCLHAGTTEQSREQCGAGGHACTKCTDGLSCTNDACVDGGCIFDLLPDTCLINATCYAKEEVSPEVACQICHPSVDHNSWDWLPACVFTIAGTGIPGAADGPLFSAEFFVPTGVAVSGLEKVYVTDRGNNVIRKITETGVTTYAGSGTAGFLDGPAAAALFSSPESLAIDSSGVIYVADTGNDRVRIISGGVVSTLASGLPSPSGVAVGGDGRVYVVDVASHQIFVIIPGSGATTSPTLLAGSGTPGANNGAALTASFNGPMDLAVDDSHAVYVADTGNSLIRVIADGQVTTLAGSSAGFFDGPALTAKLAFPEGIAVSPDGKMVIVADSANNRIRTIHQGVVETLAGSGAVGKDDGPVTTATFYDPTGVTLAENGGVVVADKGNNLIRAITAP